MSREDERGIRSGSTRNKESRVMEFTVITRVIDATNGSQQSME